MTYQAAQRIFVTRRCPPGRSVRSIETVVCAKLEQGGSSEAVVVAGCCVDDDISGKKDQDAADERQG